MHYIHSADFHLSKNLRLNDFSSSLSQIKDFALGKKCNFILVAGDIFHRKTPDNQARDVFYSWVKSLESIKIFALVGTHDADVEFHSLTPLKSLGLSNLIVLDTLDLGHYDINGESIEILSIPHLVRDSDIKVLETLLGSLVMKTGYKIVLGHFSVVGAECQGYVVNEKSGDFVLPKALFKDPKIDYIALGHIHKHQEIDRMRYAGSIERVNFGEIKNEPGFYFVEDEKVSFVPLEVRPMVDVVVGDSELSDISIPEKALVRLVVKRNSFDFNLREARRIIRERKGELVTVTFDKKEEEKDASSKEVKAQFWTDLVLEEMDAVKGKEFDKEKLKRMFSEVTGEVL